MATYECKRDGSQSLPPCTDVVVILEEKWEKCRRKVAYE